MTPRFRAARAAAILLAIAGCGSSDGTPAAVPNGLPSLTFLEDAAPIDAQIGSGVVIRFTATDAEDAVLVDVLADADGDIASTADRLVLAAGMAGGAGPEQCVWDTGGVPEGEYHVIAIVRDGVNDPVVVRRAGKVRLWTMWPLDHSNIVLRDRLGAPIHLGSAEPYSPRETCGTCHDVDAISNGYHFQQGRTDATGAVIMADDFFRDGRDFLESPGMYGKW